MRKTLKYFIPYRKPDVIIGPKEQPYLLRWHLIPRNKRFNIYLHKFLGDDIDRALHDHPWESWSFIIRGKYIEHRPGGKVQIFKKYSWIYREPKYAHRIELFRNKVLIDEPTFPGEYIKVPRRVWTLFITGPKKREWGFLCEKGWRHWRNFVNPNNNGLVGRGCDAYDLDDFGVGDRVIWEYSFGAHHYKYTGTVETICDDFIGLVLDTNMIGKRVQIIDKGQLHQIRRIEDERNIHKS